MSPWTALRSTGAPWLFPLVFAVASTVGANNLTFATGYPTSDLAATSLGVVFVSPFLAGYVASRFGGLARYARSIRPGRSGLGVVLAAFWPLLLAAPCVATLGAVLAARTYPRDLPSTGLVATVLVTASACGVWGLILATAVPAVLAAPLGVVSTYYWLLFTPSLRVSVLHNMVGWFPACCDPGEVPAAGAMAGGLVVALIVFAGALGALALRRWAFLPRTRGLVLTIVTVSAALCAGRLTVDGLISHPTLQGLEPRQTRLTCGATSQVQLCVWPENKGRIALVLREAERLDDRLASWGLRDIGRMSERPTDAASASVSAGQGLTVDDLRLSLAAGYVDRAAGCAGSFGRGRDERVAFLAMALGLGRRQLAGRVTPDAIEAAVDRYDRAGKHPDEVRAWFDGADRPVCRSAP